MTGKNKKICILGMHRSGSSLCAQWLHLNGIFMGERLLCASSSNIDGHFEDLDFLELNEEILLHNGEDSRGLSISKNPVLFEIEKKYLNRKTELLNSKNKNLQWAFKDPRTCILIDFYKKELEDFFILATYRSLKNTVCSLIKRDIKVYIETLNKLEKIKYFFRKKNTSKKILNNNLDNYIKSWYLYNQTIIKYLNSRFINEIIEFDVTNTNSNSKFSLKQI